MKKYELLDKIREYASNTLPNRNKFKPGIDDVSVSGAVISSDDIVSICDTVLDGWFTEGHASKTFSELLSDYLGIAHVVLCNSGSSANLIALSAVKDQYKINHKKKVIVCATEFPTVVAPIIQVGLVPLFIDADPRTLNSNTETIRELLERDDVAGIIEAHTLGFPFDAISVCEACAKHEKFFIEDNCDSLGSLIDDELTGRFGDISTMSFFPAHTITTGEGGALAVTNPQLYKLIRNYRDWGRDCWCLPGQDNTCGKRFEREWKNLPPGYDHKYTFTKVGYNLKITDMQAALGVSQFQSLQEFVDLRKCNYQYLLDGLCELSEHLQFVEPLPNSEPSPFGFPMSVISSATTRKDFVNYLEQNKIRTRPVFAGNIVRQPMMENVQYRVAEDLTGSDWIMENTFWIGCHPGLTSTHLDYVLENIYKYFKKEI
jgi:CDP-4-dehydro-6-deoxyglucose reductase, E1